MRLLPPLARPVCLVALLVALPACGLLGTGVDPEAAAARARFVADSTARAAFVADSLDRVARAAALDAVLAPFRTEAAMRTDSIARALTERQAAVAAARAAERRRQFVADSLARVQFVADSLAAAEAERVAAERRRRAARERSRRGRVIRTGGASYYAAKFNGRRTANGERYRPGRLTAAHRTLRFGTRVRVTNLRNGRSVVVRINDRGPFVRGRIIDLSRAAAQRIGMIRSGVARVRLEVL